MEYAYSIMMFIMAGALLVCAGLTAATKTLILPRRYKVSYKARDKKLYAVQFAKAIAIIACAFLVSGLVGLTKIYVLAVILLIAGIVGGIVIAAKLVKKAM